MMCITLMEKLGEIRGRKNLNLFLLFEGDIVSEILKLGRGVVRNERTIKI